MLSCREVTRLVSDGLERELPLRQRMKLRLHVMMCRSCSAYRRQVRALDRLIRGATRRGRALPGGNEGGPGLDPEAKRRIKTAVRERQSRPE